MKELQTYPRHSCARLLLTTLAVLSTLAAGPTLAVGLIALVQSTLLHTETLVQHFECLDGSPEPKVISRLNSKGIDNKSLINESDVMLKDEECEFSTQ